MTQKALVVDNNYFFVKFLSELLEKRGYRVIKAYDGKEGIARLDDGPIDIVFADLIMPKIDVRRFIEFIRIKYQDTPIPIVALSGTVVEQLGELDEIGADFYIPKGPIDRLTIQLNEFMAEIETGPFYPPSERKVFKSQAIFPRREAMELLNNLQFHRAIIENIGVGLIVVDKDTRVMNANSMALDIIQKSAVDILNCKVADLFPGQQRSELKQALNHVIQEQGDTRISFYTSFNHHSTRTIVTPIIYEDNQSGWVVTLDDSEKASE
jgi:PAS domain S-box-containing protein